MVEEKRPGEGEVRQRRKKKKRAGSLTLGGSFLDSYKLGERLGQGSAGLVRSCTNINTGQQFAVKIISKRAGAGCRGKVLKEIEIYHLCRGCPQVIQLAEYYEEEDAFFLVFERMGGPLLEQIQRRRVFTEREAARIVGQLARGLQFLHSRGIAHRDIKPDNVLCGGGAHPLNTVKLCDFDLCSEPSRASSTTPSLSSPVGSLEYMAPEVVNTFCEEEEWEAVQDEEEEEELRYTKKCDLWSLGILAYILLCGYAPFSADCGADCGWEEGAACQACQALLFSSIRGCRLQFPAQQWAGISGPAHHLVRSLLTKDSVARLSAEQVLQHPWVVAGEAYSQQESSDSLATPRNLASAGLSLNTSRILEAARVLETGPSPAPATAPLDIPAPRPATRPQSLSFVLAPPGLSSCSLAQRRRRKSQQQQLPRFSSIEELESDFFMRTIC